MFSVDICPSDDGLGFLLGVFLMMAQRSEGIAYTKMAFGFKMKPRFALHIID